MTGSSFSVGATVTVGIDVSLAEVAGAGLSASVATTETEGTSQSASVALPIRTLEVRATDLSGHAQCQRRGSAEKRT